MENEQAYLEFALRAYPLLLQVDEGFRITFASPQCAERIELPPDSLLGTPLTDLVAPEVAESLQQSLILCAERRTQSQFETVLLVNGSRRVPLDLLAIPLNDEGQPYRWAIASATAQETPGAQSALDKSYYELTMLQQISDAVLSILDLRKIIFAILTCVTAHPALGFTRAFLFIVDRKTNSLVGKMAVGPRDAQEAYRIWSELGRFTWRLRDFIDQYETLEQTGQLPLTQTVAPVSISLEAEGDILIETIRRNEPQRVIPERADPRVPASLRHILCEAEFVTMPLAVKNEVIGLIVADNAYKGLPITDEGIRVLRLFSNHVAVVLNNAAIHEDLQEKIRLLEKMQNRLVQSERLSTIGEMATQVAHEIRNPLVAIGGLAMSALKKIDPGDRNFSKIETIVRESQRLEQILQEMLEFCRPRSLGLEETNIGELVCEVCAFMEEEAAKRGIDLIREIHPAIGPVWVDRHKMTQVLLNVLTNAMDATERGRRIFARTRINEDHCVIEIADEGIGIEEEIREKIFTPFFTTKARGLGIGLSLTRDLVQAHQGKIEVDSRPGEGTVFRITLPRIPNDEPAEAISNRGAR